MVRFSCPGNTSDETQKFMKDVLKALNGNNAAQNIDLGALRMLANSYEAYLQASDALLREGVLIKNRFGETIAHPAQTIATKSYNQVMKIMTEYGLTIKSRSKISSMKDQEKDDSPLDQFFSGKIEKR